MTQTRYWIVKGNPRYPIAGVDRRCGDIVRFLKNYSSTKWLTYKHIKDSCSAGDRVFLWQSSPYLHIIGLGTIEKVLSRRSAENHFIIQHEPEKSLLKKPVTIAEIRSAFDEGLSSEEQDKAGYLKRSVVATLYEVSQKQAEILIELVRKANPRNGIIKTWSGELRRPERSTKVAIRGIEQDASLRDATEGTPKEILRTEFERDPRLRRACINHYAKRMGGQIRCFACKFDFEARYGEVGIGYIHVHHELPLSLARRRHRPDPIKEMKPLCANCHAIIHRDPRKPLSVEELINLVHANS